MLTHIELKNFKCFRHVSLDPKRITVLIGPNGSGKSSLLQALLLLKQSVGQSAIKPNGNIINLGDSFADLVTKTASGTQHPVEISIGGRSRWEPEAEFAQRLSLDAQGGVADLAARLVFPIDGKEWTLETMGSQAGWGVEPSKMLIPPVTFNFSGSSTIGRPFQGPGTSWPNDMPESQRAQVADIQRRLQKVIASIAVFLENLVWVPVLRGLPQPSYQLSHELQPQLHFAKSFDFSSLQMASNLEYARESQRRIWDLMERITGTGISTRTVPPVRVEVVAHRRSLTVNIVNEGFGTNQLVALLQSLVLTEKFATVLIEEPEIHLHPRAQGKLASVLVEIAKKEDKQIIFTTHSEHMLHRLLTLVASNELSPEELTIYAFDLGEDGIATAQPLEVDERGRVKGGLKGFFEVELEELDQYIQALGQWKARSAESSS